MNDEEFLEKQKIILSLCPDVDRLVFAAKQYLGVTFFRYVKSFPNGDKFILCNNSQWLSAYFKEKYYFIELADYQKHPEGSQGVHIHHPCTRDHPACNFWRSQEKVGDYTTFCYFFTKYKNYFESYNFGLHGDTHQTNDTFFNNQNLYKHFFLYFKSTGKDLLKTAYEARFNAKPTGEYDLKNNWLLGVNTQLSKIVMEEMPLREIFLDDELENIFFTIKEARSLRTFVEGYSIQYSADMLGIDQTTHVKLLTDIMEKLKVKSYDELRKMCHERNISAKLSSLSKNIT